MSQKKQAKRKTNKQTGKDTKKTAERASVTGKTTSLSWTAPPIGGGRSGRLASLIMTMDTAT